jgi:hypothetical protein
MMNARQMAVYFYNSHECELVKYEDDSYEIWIHISPFIHQSPLEADCVEYWEVFIPEEFEAALANKQH